MQAIGTSTSTVWLGDRPRHREPQKIFMEEQGAVVRRSHSHIFDPVVVLTIYNETKIVFKIHNSKVRMV